MYRLLPLVALSSLAGASIIPQQPLAGSSNPEAPLISDSKELVSSSALEAHITKENLLKRAKQLYKIAEEGAPEYNHPTRVIGSQGRLRFYVLTYPAPLLTLILHRSHLDNRLHILDNRRSWRLLRDQQPDV